MAAKDTAREGAERRVIAASSVAAAMLSVPRAARVPAACRNAADARRQRTVTPSLCSVLICGQRCASTPPAPAPRLLRAARVTPRFQLCRPAYRLVTRRSPLLFSSAQAFKCRVFCRNRTAHRRYRRCRAALPER